MGGETASGLPTAGGLGPPGEGGGELPNPLSNPFGPPGGNPGGGGGNPSNHLDKLSGQPPTIYEGDRQTSEAFIQEWNM